MDLPQHPVVIEHDAGGSLAQRIPLVVDYGIFRREVHILGYCASACTLYLGLPDVCVSPDATFVFKSRADSAYWTRQAFEFYPPMLREAIQTNASPFVAWQTTGRLLIDDLGFRPCL